MIQSNCSQLFLSKSFPQLLNRARQDRGTRKNAAHLRVSRATARQELTLHEGVSILCGSQPPAEIARLALFDHSPLKTLRASGK
ncbi:hypothetical protein B5K06_33620 [Rhizobium grahamii]|uniref:Uncharacterized protein n=1 Tax=Rhizobium grahamii TaxID=1120045 RepID=A0A370KDR4_9HYPH|nr:hypothetical protein B5K06_33620 [Rhizobium grahamii]